MPLKGFITLVLLTNFAHYLRVFVPGKPHTPSPPPTATTTHPLTQATDSVTQAFIHSPLRVSFRISRLSLFFLAQQLKHFLKVTNTHAFVNLYEKGIVAAMASKNSKMKKKNRKNGRSKKTMPKT